MIIEHEKIINLSDNTTNQPFKFRKWNLVDINDESKGKYDDRNIKFKASMIRSSSCDYNDAYIF